MCVHISTFKLKIIIKTMKNIGLNPTSLGTEKPVVNLRIYKAVDKFL